MAFDCLRINSTTSAAIDLQPRQAAAAVRIFIASHFFPSRSFPNTKKAMMIAKVRQGM
jgi:hypothetical protein